MASDVEHERTERIELSLMVGGGAPPQSVYVTWADLSAATQAAMA